jgi:hypothetical protein
MTDIQVSPTASAKKSKPVKKLPTLGDLIVAAYDLSEKKQAAGMVSLALRARLIEFEGPRRPVTFDRTSPFAREKKE